MAPRTASFDYSSFPVSHQRSGSTFSQKFNIFFTMLLFCYFSPTWSYKRRLNLSKYFCFLNNRMTCNRRQSGCIDVAANTLKWNTQKMDGEICLNVYIVTAINYKLIYSRHLLRKNSQIFPLICTFVGRYSVLPA